MLIRKYSLEVWYINILGNAVAEKFVGKEFQEKVFLSLSTDVYFQNMTIRNSDYAR